MRFTHRHKWQEEDNESFVEDSSIENGMGNFRRLPPRLPIFSTSEVMFDFVSLRRLNLSNKE